MTDIILVPLIAFFVYFLVISMVSGLGRLFAASGLDTKFKSGTYASGEEGDPVPVAYGYRKFFVVALFFAVLHLGVLMLGSSGMSLAAGPYLIGLMLVLVALILE